MTDPRKLSINDFAYSLPEEKIARYPLPERDDSRLLIYKNGMLEETTYRHIGGYIPDRSLLVFNDTKVIAARLLFQKPSEGMIEIFCLAPHEQYPDITGAMARHEKVLWQCLIGGASKWKHGLLLEKKIQSPDAEIILQARYVEKRSDSFVIELSWQPVSFSFSEILYYAGAIPLPPYMKREAESADTERYQTVYARSDGSVAAPTAGLHFTPRIFENLKSKRCDTAFVTLHVGAGTFKPVKTHTMNDHEMHAEYIDVKRETIEQLLHHIEETVIAVGTTSLRTIESLYWLGVKLAGNNQDDNKSASRPLLELDQWEPYDMPEQDIPAKRALQALLTWMDRQRAERLIAKTKIIIAPGYKIRVAKALVTNFHQPQSTLLLLVAALTGENWKKIYDYALRHDFRFLSYGDGSLLWIDKDATAGSQ